MTTQPPSNEAVEAAIAYSSINHRVDAMSEDVQRILWANVKPDCTGYSSAYALTAARILAAEVERLRAQAGAVCEWTLDSDDDCWDTQCDVYSFNVKFRTLTFCPGCGRKVKIATEENEPPAPTVKEER